MRKFVSVVVALLGTISIASAQRIVNDTHTYRYVISDTETLKQAEVSAIQEAQRQMIANNFGTIVGSTTAMTIGDEVKSVTYGEADIKGYWLADNAAPIIRKSVVNDHFVLDVTVSGKIQEIVTTPIDLRCAVLKNGLDDKYASTEFKNDDRLYLYFKSPVDGYLAVYLGDDEIVNCLFPYNGASQDIMKVSAGEEYVLFSKTKPGNLDPVAVQEFPLGCSPGNEMEMVRLYIVFSPNKFSKANDYAHKTLRYLPFEEFHTWLSKNRRIDTEMNIKSYDIVIRKK